LNHTKYRMKTRIVMKIEDNVSKYLFYVQLSKFHFDISPPCGPENIKSITCSKFLQFEIVKVSRGHAVYSCMLVGTCVPT
jgi:hypothetical protein